MTHTREATTEIRFPSDRHFSEFRDEVKSKYSPAMVRVERCAVYTDGRGTLAEVHHSRGLGAELKGLAHSRHEGNSVRTIFNEEK